MKLFPLAKKNLSKSLSFFSAACFNITTTINQDLFVILALLNIGNLATQINNRTWSTIAMPIRNALHCFIYKYLTSINNLTNMSNWFDFVRNKNFNLRPIASSGIDVDQHKHNTVIHCLSSDSTPSLFSMIFGHERAQNSCF